jgi:hypothetical protein
MVVLIRTRFELERSAKDGTKERAGAEFQQIQMAFDPRATSQNFALGAKV